MSRTKLLVALLCCWQTAGFAQNSTAGRAEGISFPIRIEYAPPSVGLSEKVFINMAPPGSGVSEKVSINVNPPLLSKVVTEKQTGALENVLVKNEKPVGQQNKPEALAANEQKNDAGQPNEGVTGVAGKEIIKLVPNLSDDSNKDLTSTNQIPLKQQKSSDFPAAGNQKNEAIKLVSGVDKTTLTTNPDLKNNPPTALTNKIEEPLQEQKSLTPLVVNQIANTTTDKVAVGGSNPKTNPEPVSAATGSTTEKLVPESSGIPKYYALLIGVSNYLYASSQFSSLEEPVKDVRRLEKVLVQKYEFAPTNVKVLVDPKRGDILDELDQMARVITEKDNLLIFFAGHGTWDDKSQVGYWLPADARPDRKADWIPNSTLQDYVGGIFSKHTLLISDACFSGSIFKVRGTDLSLSDFGTSKLYQLPSRKAMTSGNLKNVPDKSKFLEYLVKRLEENEDRYLPARILFDRIYIAVINNTNSVPLYGVVHSTGDEGGDFIFIKKQQ